MVDSAIFSLSHPYTLPARFLKNARAFFRKRADAFLACRSLFLRVYKLFCSASRSFFGKEAATMSYD